MRGVAQVLDEPRYTGSITLADGGDASLAQVAKPLAVDGLIGLAEQLARAVAAMHGRGVMHHDIRPANILTSPQGAPCLVDFASATSLAEIRPEFAHHTQIVGTLSYSAPEQTGRTGRPVDHRADLYALGATLYELATGEPPFGSADPLRLMHDHLARVPDPPNEINPAVPQALSAIIMHLLEKEPDDRYQSANGVIHDLVQLRELGVSTTAAPGVGARDFPLRLVPPSRLIGRDDEVTMLQEAFDDALRGECRGVLVSGPPGVGKTALIDQLRPVVTGNDGWFVAGKFDQYRRDLEFDGIFQAFRALGRLLLAEPDDELAELRERMLTALGANAGITAAVLPEFAVLLSVPPEAGDPLTAQVRVQHSAVDMLRAVASRKRPVMLFVDDLQWASPTSVGVIDLVLREQVEGLLLVGAHRDRMDPAHPLSPSLARWRDQPGVTQLQLANLPGPSLTALVAEILRVDQAAAGALAEIIEPHTEGNPYETTELLNRLRQEGVLTPTSTGWRWDEPAVRSLLGQSEVAARPMARLAAIPPTSREMVEVMACLGGRAELSVLRPRPLNRPMWWSSFSHRPSKKAYWWPRPASTTACGSVMIASAKPSWPTGCRTAAQPATRARAAAGDRSRVVRRRRRPVPTGHRRGLGSRGAVSCGGAVAARRRAGFTRGRVRPGSHAAHGRAAGGRRRRCRHADRAAHRPPRRVVQLGAAGGGRRGLPHHRPAHHQRAAAGGRHMRAGAQPDQPQISYRRHRACRGCAERAGRHRPSR